MREFNCTKCGLCCKAVHLDLLKQFGLPESPSGGCGHLQKDMSCGIYEIRPIICRVKEGHEQIMNSAMPWDEWVELNEDSCKELQRQDELRRA